MEDSTNEFKRRGSTCPPRRALWPCSISYTVGPHTLWLRPGRERPENSPYRRNFSFSSFERCSYLLSQKLEHPFHMLPLVRSISARVLLGQGSGRAGSHWVSSVPAPATAEKKGTIRLLPRGCFLPRQPSPATTAQQFQGKGKERGEERDCASKLPWPAPVSSSPLFQNNSELPHHSEPTNQIWKRLGSSKNG